jgi:hypothetical protein
MTPNPMAPLQAGLGGRTDSRDLRLLVDSLCELIGAGDPLDGMSRSRPDKRARCSTSSDTPFNLAGRRAMSIAPGGNCAHSWSNCASNIEAGWALSTRLPAPSPSLPDEFLLRPRGGPRLVR